MSWKMFFQIVLLIIIASIALMAAKYTIKKCRPMADMRKMPMMRQEMPR